MPGYYNNKLAANKLKQCYDLAEPRIQQYLRAEMQFVLGHVTPDQSVLDLGCGYGRTLKPLAERTTDLTGIDNSLDSLRLAREQFKNNEAVALALMDAANLGFSDQCFDLSLCLQNGLSAFHVDPRRLIDETVRVTKPGGLILLSTYSEHIWTARLDWFQLQAEAGLIGEIDYEQTADGIIVCRDGFKAITFAADQLRALTDHLAADIRIVEIDRSSLFCKIRLKS